MRLNDYVHLELDSSDEYFDVKPTKQLTGKHQVAIVDVAYAHEGERRLGEHDSSIIRNDSTEIILCIEIQKEGLKSNSNRQAFKRGNYTYDPTKKTYVREFDIWNYQINDEVRERKEFALNPIKEGFRFEKTKTFTLKGIVGLINSAFEGLTDAIKEHLRKTFEGTSGDQLIINDEYFQLPKLVLNEEEGTTYLHLPYYVSSIALTDWLNVMLGDILGEKMKSGPWKYYVRQMVGIPNPIKGIEGVTSRGIFQVLDPCAIIRGGIKASEYEWDEANAFISSDLIAPHPVGDRTIPLLRMFPLKNKLGMNWMQFTNLHYFDVKYQQITGFNIAL